MSKTPVLVIGGGMIAQDQILPSLYQLQRLNVIDGIAVCARRASTLDALADSQVICRAFPGHSFTRALDPYPQVIAKMPPRSIVIVALPDQIHYEAIMTALRADQHVI